MNMRNHIAKSGDIDFIWVHDMAHGLFNSEYQSYQMLALTMGKVRHLSYVTIPYHPTKTREVWVVDENDSTVISAPNKLTLFRLEFVFTKYAIDQEKNVNENGTYVTLVGSFRCRGSMVLLLTTYYLGILNGTALLQ